MLQCWVWDSGTVMTQVSSLRQTGSCASLLPYSPQIKSRLQSLLQPSTEDQAGQLWCWVSPHLSQYCSRRAVKVEDSITFLCVCVEWGQSENDKCEPVCFCGPRVMSPVRAGPTLVSNCPSVWPDYVLNPPVCWDGCGKNVCWRELSGAVATRREQPRDSTPLEW